jgi:competence protein ComEC
LSVTIELNSRSFRRGNSIGKPSALGASLLAERHRWPLWLPVALGTGTALYFASPFEPAPLIAGAMALACLAAGLGAYQSHDPWARAVLALGFGNAKGRELRMAAPVVPHPIITHLTGRVVALGWGRAGLRAVLDEVRSGRLPDPSSRVRVLVRKGGEILGIGQGVDLTAQLMPPPGPATPGDSDFARAAYFARLGAVGFAFGAPGIAPLPHAPTLSERISGLVESMRAAVTARIRAQLPDSEGAIASAIITGERGGIDPDDEAALRDAGLAHVLAIAGLAHGAGGGGPVLAGPCTSGAHSRDRARLSDQEMGGGLGAGRRGLLSYHQRRLVFLGARLRDAGDDVAGGAVRPARPLDAQPGAGRGDSSFDAA